MSCKPTRFRRSQKAVTLQERGLRLKSWRVAWVGHHPRKVPFVVIGANSCAADVFQPAVVEIHVPIRNPGCWNSGVVFLRDAQMSGRGVARAAKTPPRFR